LGLIVNQRVVVFVRPHSSTSSAAGRINQSINQSSFSTMDALAGYGSDDSSSASSSGPNKSEAPAASSLSGLLGNVSDASEDESAAVDRPTTGESQPPPAKKPKMAGASNSDAITTSKPTLLPEPILSKGENDSWIYWKTNYLRRPLLGNDHHRLSLLQLDDAPSIQELQENLQRLAQNDNNTDAHQNWADRLRSQHEFHNPHFFATVVEHFGIQDPLGSAFPLATTTDVRDYERKLFPIIIRETTEESSLGETAT
jgi:hypothetical protein